MAPSLPTEIIQLIYGELRPDATESVAAALSVSAISRYWRAVALSTPSLWSTFSFCLRTHDEAMLSAFFERSLQQPLSLTISFEFPNSDTVHTSKIQHTLTLFLRNTDRIQHLRLRFFTPMHDQTNFLGQFICFKSLGLKSLEIESLNAVCFREELISELYTLVIHHKQTWSERCPALTHVRCTDPRLLGNGPSNMTCLCIKGDLGRVELDLYSLPNFWAGTKALTRLVIDGVPLRAIIGDVSLPHLQTLSLRDQRENSGSHTAEGFTTFFRSLDVPALVSLTIHYPNEVLPGLLNDWSVCFPSVTQFTVVPCSSGSFSYYSRVLPGVEELVLIDSDPEFGLIGLWGGDWPSLHAIDLTHLDLTPDLKDLSETLCQYGHRRFQSGRRSQLMVTLPRGILPRDVLLDVSEFMDLCSA